MRLFSESLLLALLLVQGSRGHQPIFHAPVVSLQPIAAPAWLHGGSYAHTHLLPSGPNYAHQRIITHGAPVIHYGPHAPAIVTVHKSSARPLVYGFPSLGINDYTPDVSNVNPPAAGLTSIGDRNVDYNRRGWIRPSAPVYKSLRGDRVEEVRSWTGPSVPAAYKPHAVHPFVGLNGNDEQTSMRKEPNLATPSRQASGYPVPTRLDESSLWPVSLQDDSLQAQFGSRVPRGAARRRGEGAGPGFGDRGKLRWPFEIDFAALNKTAAESSGQPYEAPSDSDATESPA
ncbi:hypothetical protein MTO96_018636 [Rhipicephalus appendiculatus]